MTAKTILASLARMALASLAGALVHHGWLQSSGVEAFVGVGMLAASGAWGLWTNYGRDIATAALQILRAKVMNAAALARANPSAAAPALAKLDQHVAATPPT